MGCKQSKNTAQVRIDSAVSDNAQVCGRGRGNEICPLHPGHTVTTLCCECNVLVCLECLYCPEHVRHTFKKLQDCLRGPMNNIAKRVNDLQKHTIQVDEDIFDIEIMQAEYENIRNTNIKNAQQRKLKTRDREHLMSSLNIYYDAVQHILDHNKQLFQSYKERILGTVREYKEVFESGSDVLKYETGVNMPTMQLRGVPKTPNIPNLANIDTEHIHSAIYQLHESHPDLLRSSGDPIYQDLSAVSVVSTFENDTQYHSVAPVSKNTAWVAVGINTLQLITNTGTILRTIEIDINVTFYSLSANLQTRELFGGFDDNVIRSIDISSGATKSIIKCEYVPNIIKVTKDGYILVGFEDPEFIHKYEMNGFLAQTSAEKYEVFDIDHYPITNKVLLSCQDKGLVLVDSNLNKCNTFLGRPGPKRYRFLCATAAFDNSGDVIVGDYLNREMYVLSGENLQWRRKLNAPLSCPLEIKLCQNMIWVVCDEPHQIICIEFENRSIRSFAATI